MVEREFYVRIETVTNEVYLAVLRFDVVETVREIVSGWMNRGSAFSVRTASRVPVPDSLGRTKLVYFPGREVWLQPRHIVSIEVRDEPWA